jgi:NADPH-dependent glutamate synthase beta subunit-like oxidoreductase
MEDTHNTSAVLDKMKEIAEGCMGEDAAACVATCPMHTDAKGYVGLISEKKFKEALLLIRETLFLPGTLGRICPHPCEEKCKRGEMKNPLSIAALKRFAADHYDSESLWDLGIAPEKPNSVAIIGAGPSGAQAALDLRKKGYKVTVYERLPVVGGMLRVGIPEYRLPAQIIEKEYSLLKKIGVEFILGKAVGKDISFSKLREDYDAVLIAIGAQKGNVLPIPGTDLKGVQTAVDFLRSVSLNQPQAIGRKVVVIGGGCVGIDAARTAIRLGAKDVRIICIEGKDEMPAHAWEIKDAEDEGITIRSSCGPLEIIGKAGKVSGLKVRRCTSVFDGEGRFCPRFDDNDTDVITGVDSVIFAVGQLVDSAGLAGELIPMQSGGRYKVNSVTLQTCIENVFASGDATARSVIAIEAMAEGRRAAESIDRYLSGQDLYQNRASLGSYETKLDKKIDADEPNLPRIPTTLLPPAERMLSFTEADLGFNEAKAVEEASRCFQCECRDCMKECLMLNDFTTCPGELFRGIIAKGDVDPLIPFSCNMCKQCTLVCPNEFLMMDRFMDLRIQMTSRNRGKSPMKGHKAIDIHQMLGFSRFFNTTLSANHGSKTKRVFIPGCSLPSYNPELVGNILLHLQDRLPGTGAILKCCGKPTKALGQVEAFKERYAELQAEIDRVGAEEIIVACQSCYVTMKEYSPNQKVRSLWEVLPEIGLPEGAAGIGKDSGLNIAVHDSCPTRDVPEISDGIRQIMGSLGYAIEEPAHTREKTLCCGFGGMVVPANPDLARRVMERRTEEVKSDVMVTYCAACRESMIRGGKKAVHILDLIFGGPYKADSVFPGPGTSPITAWVNRYKAKSIIRSLGQKPAFR